MLSAVGSAVTDSHWSGGRGLTTGERGLAGGGHQVRELEGRRQAPTGVANGRRRRRLVHLPVSDIGLTPTHGPSAALNTRHLPQIPTPSHWTHMSAALITHCWRDRSQPRVNTGPITFKKIVSREKRPAARSDQRRNHSLGISLAKME